MHLHARMFECGANDSVPGHVLDVISRIVTEFSLAAATTLTAATVLDLPT